MTSGIRSNRVVVRRAHAEALLGLDVVHPEALDFIRAIKLFLILVKSGASAGEADGDRLWGISRHSVVAEHGPGPDM